MQISKITSYAPITRIRQWRNKRAASPLWTVAVGLVVVVMLLPVVSIAMLALQPGPSVWGHLISTVLPGSIFNTLLLMLGAGVVTLIIGTSSAWLISMYKFPGRDILDWMLILPLAMPTYIIAFCYVEILDYSSGLQTSMRTLFGWNNARDYWFPEIRSLGGAILVMSLVLYPYVYLTARASFLQQSICVIEVARTLGRTVHGTFWEVAVPLARPALVAGLALVLMECMNDIGAVEYFGVQTLTVSVYTTWLERSSLSGAAQIAAAMLVFVVAVFGLERAARGQRRFHNTTGHHRAMPAIELEGAKQWVPTILCSLPVGFGFVLPLVILIKDSIRFSDEALDGPFWLAARNSVALATTAAVIAVVFAILLAYARRAAGNGFTRPAVRLAGLGYAIPGTVLAVGLLIPLAAFDNAVDAYFRAHWQMPIGLLLSGSVFALLLAYVIRFMAISLGAIEAGLERISPNLDAASRTLGKSAMNTLWHIHLPLVRPAASAAALLVFVDVMKELPATLLLRPFNFDTLATHVYGFASLEQFEEAGLAALTIVLFGLAPLFLLHRTIASGRAGHGLGADINTDQD